MIFVFIFGLLKSNFSIMYSTNKWKNVDKDFAHLNSVQLYLPL